MTPEDKKHALEMLRAEGRKMGLTEDEIDAAEAKLEGILGAVLADGGSPVVVPVDIPADMKKFFEHIPFPAIFAQVQAIKHATDEKARDRDPKAVSDDFVQIGDLVLNEYSIAEITGLSGITAQEAVLQAQDINEGLRQITMAEPTLGPVLVPMGLLVAKGSTNVSQTIVYLIGVIHKLASQLGYDVAAPQAEDEDERLFGPNPAPSEADKRVIESMAAVMGAVGAVSMGGNTGGTTTATNDSKTDELPDFNFGGF